MHLLLHICCGPCAVFPVKELQKEHKVTGFFFNPNIHPFREFKKRLQGVRQFAEYSSNLQMVIEPEYGLKTFMQQVVFKEDTRCPICYQMRLEKAAQQAVALGLDGFTTTLLYSRYQNHETIRSIGEKLAEKYTTTFYYDDFRSGWQEGIDASIAMNLYRQPYCGCIYSEQERYDKKLKKGKGNG